MSTKRRSSLLEFGSCDHPARRITIGSIATLQFYLLEKYFYRLPLKLP
jgi:hypothetical protein